jgi:hypothetical protein
MKQESRLPRLFVASSKEGLDVAHHLQENLEFDAEVTVWTQGIFKPSRQTMSDLTVAMRATDFAAFVFTPDDVILMRGLEIQVARDNVIFELGLFAGYLGIEKCFIIHPRGTQELHFPSDLLGLTTISYESKRSDQNLLAALAPAANKIKRAMREALVNQSMPTHTPEMSWETAQQKWKRLLALWTSETLQKDRQLVRSGMPSWVGEDETGIPTAAFKRICIYLDSVAELVLSEPILQAEAKSVFAEPIKSVWNLAAYYFINHAATNTEEFWASREMPPMKQLYDLWNKPA